MTGIVLGDTPAELSESAETTQDKLTRQFTERIDWDKAEQTGADPEYAPVDPGLSVGEILAEHGAEVAYAPKWKLATFRVPMGIRMPQYERFRNDLINRWVIEMERMGWDLDSSSPVCVQPGPYPARDLTTNLEIPGYRDMQVAARFRERNPEVRRIELPSELFEPTQLLEPLPHERGGR